MKLSFEKTDGRWYLVAPEWRGPHDALQMVAGADSMLDELAESAFVTLDIWREFPIEGGYQHARLLSHGWYKTDSGKDFWLCSVTEWVFGEYPKEFWFRVSKED